MGRVQGKGREAVLIETFYGRLSTMKCFICWWWHVYGLVSANFTRRSHFRTKLCHYYWYTDWNVFDSLMEKFCTPVFRVEKKKNGLFYKKFRSHNYFLFFFACLLKMSLSQRHYDFQWIKSSFLFLLRHLLFNYQYNNINYNIINR